LSALLSRVLGLLFALASDIPLNFMPVSLEPKNVKFSYLFN